jgi:ubiquinone/menaquinone biosynthesis C-methylase UbiE
MLVSEELSFVLDPAIKAYYDRWQEETRLALGPFQLEALRTRELILRHAPKPPAVVLDVGGAAGAYSFWLAEQAYEVHLIDAVPRLIEVARTRNARVASRLASTSVGDARGLPHASDSAAMVLLLGPLYHLVRAEERQMALREARRVLQANGVLVAAGISRFASTLDGLAREVLGDPAFAGIAAGDLSDGHHKNTTDRLDYFTTAYFHRPEELRREVIDAGFEVEGLYGIEGPGWILGDFEDRWSDPARREVLVNVARALETEASVIGMSAHLFVGGRKR